MQMTHNSFYPSIHQNSTLIAKNSTTGLFPDGGAENAGPENDGLSHRVENAGLEYDGPNRKA